jgi:hypothetical protein
VNPTLHTESGPVSWEIVVQANADAQQQKYKSNKFEQRIKYNILVTTKIHLATTTKCGIHKHKSILRTDPKKNNVEC